MRSYNEAYLKSYVDNLDADTITSEKIVAVVFTSDFLRFNQTSQSWRL